MLRRLVGLSRFQAGGVVLLSWPRYTMVVEESALPAFRNLIKHLQPRAKEPTTNTFLMIAAVTKFQGSRHRVELWVLCTGHIHQAHHVVIYFRCQAPLGCSARERRFLPCKERFYLFPAGFEPTRFSTWSVCIFLKPQSSFLVGPQIDVQFTQTQTAP